MTKDLNMKKVCNKMVLKSISIKKNNEKRNLLKYFSRLLEEPDLLGKKIKTVTGDET